jgi:hypothetical protein
MSPGLKDNLKAAVVVAGVTLLARILWNAKQSNVSQAAQSIPYNLPSTGDGSSPIDWSKFTYNQPAPATLTKGNWGGAGQSDPLTFAIELLVPNNPSPSFGTCQVCKG